MGFALDFGRVFVPDRAMQALVASEGLSNLKIAVIIERDLDRCDVAFELVKTHELDCFCYSRHHCHLALIGGHDHRARRTVRNLHFAEQARLVSLLDRHNCRFRLYAAHMVISCCQCK
jgi:hypothetical protein